MAALERALAQDDSKRLRNAVETLLDKASQGEPWAIGMLADRLDGKAAQGIDITAEVTSRKAADLSDDRLAEIASASGQSQT